jgi:RimJ/RimL family protein N-acetyltransferase
MAALDDGYADRAMPRRPLSPPSQPIGDGTVMLRVRRLEDMPAIAAASRDPETLLRLQDAPLEPGRERESLARVEEQWRSGRAAPFVVADARNDEPLGLVNVQIADDGEVGRLAVSVFPAARGRGVAPRALRLAGVWGLDELGLRRVFAEADVENVASVRAIEKAGFQREGVLRAHCSTHGHRHDCVMFSLLPEDLSEPPS